MGKFLRVNMNEKNISLEDIQEEYTYYGGRGLVAKILNNEVNAACDALGPENKLIVCPGLITGTIAPSSGRLSIGGKSPLTGTIKEANAGGIVAQQLAKLDIKAIIIEGQPEIKSWHILKISKENVELLPGEKYSNMNNYQLNDELQKVYGDHVGIISIGGAGERGYKNSSIQVTGANRYPSRAAARGGLGALMGSKGLKAIILDVKGPLTAQYADKEKFTAAARNYIQGIKDNPVSGQAMPALGTAVLVNMVNAMGALTTRNYSSGRFEDAESISGEKLVEIQSKRGGKVGHSCHPGCAISCSNIYNNDKGEYLTSGMEYETIALVGANCGIKSLDTIAAIDRMCDDFGLDTMDTGITIGICMEAGKLAFGDDEGALALVQEMIDGTEFGKILGHGPEYVGKKLGVKRIPTVKGQGMAGYDPRALKGTGVTYATSPMGADHTAGNALGNPTVDPIKKEGQVDLSTNLQVGMATFDNLGMCIFAGFCTDDPKNVGYLLDMMTARFGGEWTVDRLFGIGVQTIAMEKQFNKAAGFTDKDNRLPDFVYNEPISPSNSVFDFTDEELNLAIPF
ncbi:MAG: aldehyde ferredoxin oxidoreductase C-terminal domain-containing protein [Sedimentibacter sp.]|uniref:aldehyde ferredoxin oxidoreductase C-terminal domain-containing protein n=1 Tax=Sedimentibacter sp. TaxID=1960295 RepID=UPI003158466D